MQSYRIEAYVEVPDGYDEKQLAAEALAVLRKGLPEEVFVVFVATQFTEIICSRCSLRGKHATRECPQLAEED